MPRRVDGPEITGQVTHKQTGQAYGPVTVTVTPKVYTDPEMTVSVTSLTTDGTGVFSCYAPPGNYTFTTTAVDAQTLEPVEVLGREGGTGVAIAASGPSVGLLSARPSATGSKTLYYATDTVTLYEDTATGVWTQIAETVGASANSRLIEAYGVTNGLPNLPWQQSPTSGANLWALANFSSNTNGGITPQTSSLTPTLTSDGATNKNMTTRIVIPTTGNSPANRWRIDMMVSTNITAGSNARVRIYARDAAGAALSYIDSSGNPYTATFNEWTFDSTTNVTNLRLVYEVDCDTLLNANSVIYLDVMILTDGGVAAGSTIGLTNVSVYRIHHVTPQIRITWDRANGGGSSTIAQLIASVPCGRDSARTLHRTQYTFANDGGTNLCPHQATDYLETAYNNARNTYAVSLLGSYPSTDMFINNSDTCITVYKADGVTTELLGNTHGGEAGLSGTWATDVQVFLDYGDGVWTGPFTTTAGDYVYWRHVRRVKIVASMALTRSDQPGVPFANLLKTYYIYSDGTIRYDRTVTFNQNQKVDRWFWHMISCHPDNGSSAFIGRLGRGAQILAQMDSNAYLAVPVLTATPTITASGGAIPASTRPYSVRVTALGPNGETTGSVNSGTVTVSVANSQVAPTWSAITGATGYAIYFGHPGFEKRVATVAAPTVTYTITGNELPGLPLPQTNTAVTTTQNAMASSGLCEWAAYYDPTTRHVLSLAVDRADLLSQPQVGGVRADLQRQDASIMKNYWQLQFNNGGNDLPYTVPSGTVYKGTLWYFDYIPADPVNFEREQTLRAASAAQLPNIYTT